jgi:hypothetical protein
MSIPKKAIFLCGNCGNTTPHILRFEYSPSLHYDDIPEPVENTYDYAIYSCETCQALTLLGDFQNEHPIDTEKDQPPLTRLFPKAENILPPTYTVDPSNPIPAEVYKAYVAAWPLRHLNPGAFANQIRRTIEFVCNHQKAKGKDLYAQLEDLAAKGIFPSGLSDIANLIRKLGNIGSHASKKEINKWDAELLDSLFLMVIEYVYIGPARLRRLKKRMKLK